MEKDIGALVKSIDEKLRARADADLKEEHLTLSQSFVVMFLSRRDGVATQKDIERFLDVSHPAVVGIVSRMEQNGHVTTWMDASDRRVKWVKLTPAALELSAEMGRKRQHWEDTMLRGFTDEEADCLRQFLIRVNHNLS